MSTYLEKLREINASSRTDRTDKTPKRAQEGILSVLSVPKGALFSHESPPDPPQRQAAPDLPVGSMAADLAYLVKRLGELRLQPQAAQRVRLAYARVWTEAADAEPLPHRKDNKARYAANTWLRLLSRDDAVKLGQDTDTTQQPEINLCPN